MSLHTPICDLLGIRHPILQAPMAGGWTTPALVSAVAEAGGLGNIAAGLLTIDGLRHNINAVRSATDRPFGVNFLLAPPEPAPARVDAVQDILDVLRSELGLPAGSRTLRPPPSGLDEQLALVCAERVPVISFGMGNPGPLCEQAKIAGARVLIMVTSVAEALEAEASGADAIIAQGIEAGGHRSTFRVDAEHDLPQVGTLALVPQVVDAVRVPVIAAGGIMDGRGIAAALALGAHACQLGTRFLLATESGAYPAYRQFIRNGNELSTRVTPLFTGRPARGFRNRLLQMLEKSGVDPLPWPYQALAAEDLYRHAVANADGDTMALLAGQGLRMSGREMPAHEIVADLVRQTLEVTASLPRDHT